jgi:D-arabinose 1-dehydrogenase-like Zn-dependent alcohol dehydrogenase
LLHILDDPCRTFPAAEMSIHLAAVSPAKGQPFEVQTRPTPEPGLGKLLVAVKSVALYPVDTIMRVHGLFIPAYPMGIGFDITGLVLKIGDEVHTDNSDEGPGPYFQPGVTRVATYVASF